MLKGTLEQQVVMRRYALEKLIRKDAEFDVSAFS